MSSVGTTINTDTFMVGVEYDPATGRPVKTTYPSAGGSSLMVYNSYNPTLGYLEKVASGAGGTGTVYWQATGLDAAGHVTQEKLGNGLYTQRTYDANTGWVTGVNTGATVGGGTVQNESFVYDTLGNLTSRSDSLQTYTENFNYDSLNRLRTVSGARVASYDYDSLGNIIFKSDVGTYTYGDAVRKHAVTSVAGNVNGAINPVYSYDANGNLGNGGGRTISRYTSFNMPASINSATEVVSLSYDAEHQRIVQVKNGETTEYLDARWDTGVHFEKEFKKDGSIEYQHYINAPVGQVAQYTVKVAGSVVTSTTRYLHKDHLGSVDTVTSDTGAVVTRFRYDPFGKQQTLSGDPNVTHHGYTGHEMMNGVGLINMNGRVYDPSLGRFMQADPAIQAALNLQNYNRYSYVDNNPLSATDPSGYKKFWKQDWAKKGWMAIRPYVKMAVGAVMMFYGWTTSWMGHASLFWAGAGMFLSGACEAGSNAGCGAKKDAHNAGVTTGGDQHNFYITVSGDMPAPPRQPTGGSGPAGDSTSSSDDPCGGRGCDKYGNVVDTAGMSADSGQITSDAAPDWYDARDHYRNGNGANMYIDVNSIDFTGVTDSGWMNGEKLFTFSKYESPRDFSVFGSVTLVRVRDIGFGVKPDLYNNDIKWSDGLTLRNVLTGANSALHGSGTPYTIYFTGTRTFDNLGRNP